MPAVRKWIPWIVLVAAAVAVLAVGVQHGGGRPSLDAQVQHISNEVRCPVCNGETVAQSQAAPSVQIRDEIRTDLQKGQTQGQILSSLVSSYGPGILEKPQAKGISLLVWVIPVIGVVGAGAGLLALLRRWKREGEGRADQLTDIEVPADDGGGAAGDGGGATEPEPVPAGVGALARGGATGAPVAAAPAGPAEGAAVVPDASAAPAPPVPKRRYRPTKVVLACVGVVLVAGGASWAVAASSGTRLPGQTITGQALGAPAEAAALQAAQNDESRSDVVDALKQYQKVLDSDPNQVEALSGEGWLLVETGQPSLLKQGLSLLGQAEQAQPGYAPAHLYRGLALLGESDYTDSVPELKWYLAHNPDPQLVTQVRQALSQAQAKAPAQAPAPSGQG